MAMRRAGGPGACGVTTAAGWAPQRRGDMGATMRRIRLFRAALRVSRRHFASAPPGRRPIGVALIALGLACLAVATAPMLAGAQSAPASTCVVPCDPGVRDQTPGAGGSLQGLTVAQQAFFTSGQDSFQEVEF